MCNLACRMRIRTRRCSSISPSGCDGWLQLYKNIPAGCLSLGTIGRKTPVVSSESAVSKYSFVSVDCQPNGLTHILPQKRVLSLQFDTAETQNIVLNVASRRREGAVGYESMTERGFEGVKCLNLPFAGKNSAI